VHHESNVFIPMSDGVRLAATLYRPQTSGPWPALLEAYPYRKDDISVWPDDYRRFRDEGDYLVCRLDVRGTGTSEGIAVAEYPPGEAVDLCEVVAWLARQSWCTGAVGMFGSSYSGFNAIHTAMRHPPELKAIVATYATDDRYTDDIHFGGGVRKMIEFGYPLSMVSMNALPPVPSLIGADWRERWLDRIDELVPWFDSFEEQNDGPSWRQGSLRPDYAAIEVPTMLIAGWADIYRNAMLRMMEHLSAPRRLLMGPWSHMLPIDSIPGPRIDHVPDMIRWWDRWLRGVENGVDTEPPIAIYVQRSTSPDPDVAVVPGHWRYEPEWPPARRRPLELRLEGDGGPAAIRGAELPTIVVAGDVGTTAHIRGSYPPPYGLPIDQRPDEARSLIFDWVLDEEVEILGRPTLEARIRSTAPVAFVSAKLAEVLEDGTSVLVSRGLLNLTHARSHERPAIVEPGRDVDVEIELDATSRVFAAGTRIRLAIAGADWPNGWPPPQISELSVEPSVTRLVLPHVPGPDPITERPRFVEVPAEPSGSPTARWVIEHDVYARRSAVRVEQRTTHEMSTCRAERTETVEATVSHVRPGDASVRSVSDAEVRWPEVIARARAQLDVVSDPTTYRFDLHLDVFEDGIPLRSRRWTREVARKLQ
jgi:uncharacterized protein